MLNISELKVGSLIQGALSHTSHRKLLILSSTELYEDHMMHTVFDLNRKEIIHNRYTLPESWNQLC